MRQRFSCAKCNPLFGDGVFSAFPRRPGLSNQAILARRVHPMGQGRLWPRSEKLDEATVLGRRFIMLLSSLSIRLLTTLVLAAPVAACEVFEGRQSVAAYADEFHHLEQYSRPVPGGPGGQFRRRRRDDAERQCATHRSGEFGARTSAGRQDRPRGKGRARRQQRDRRPLTRPRKVRLDRRKQGDHSDQPVLLADRQGTCPFRRRSHKQKNVERRSCVCARLAVPEPLLPWRSQLKPHWAAVVSYFKSPSFFFLALVLRLRQPACRKGERSPASSAYSAAGREACSSSSSVRTLGFNLRRAATSWRPSVFMGGQSFPRLWLAGPVPHATASRLERRGVGPRRRAGDLVAARRVHWREKHEPPPMRTRTWSLMTLFFILLGLAVYLTLAVRSTADDPWRDVSVAGYVAIGLRRGRRCGTCDRRAASAPKAPTVTASTPLARRKVLFPAPIVVASFVGRPRTTSCS